MTQPDKKVVIPVIATKTYFTFLGIQPFTSTKNYPSAGKHANVNTPTL
jgi:hypothetical protein